MNGVVDIDGDRIKGVASSGSATAIDVGGVIVPGLIDLHNHYTWNVLPRWTARKYANRYEWQEDPEYALALSGPHYALTTGGHGCDMNRFAEIKALVNGATSGVGGFANTNENKCIVGLLRNLDLASDIPGLGGLNSERLRNEVFPFELNEKAETLIRGVSPTSAENSGLLRAVVMHVGEGTDAASRREFRMLRGHGFLKDGVSVSHAVSFSGAQFAEMAKQNVGLIWSPRSNLELYGRTTDVVAAKAAGVTKFAVAPDWSPTGSSGMLSELATAWKLNVNLLGNAFKDEELFRMATANPAAMAGLSSRIGSIAAGAMADLVVLRSKSPTAYQSVLRSNAADVLLTMVGGVPVYGDSALMARLLPGASLETVTICGETKALNVTGGDSNLSFAKVSQRLEMALRGLGSALAPLAEC